MASQLGGLALRPSRTTAMTTPPSAVMVSSTRAVFSIRADSIGFLLRRMIPCVPHDSRNQPKAQACRGGGGAQAERDRPRVRGVARRAAPARQDARLRGGADVHAEARRLRLRGLLRRGQ